MSLGKQKNMNSVRICEMTNGLTPEEKQGLVNKVADLAMRDVLVKSDMVEILTVCKKACDRRIRELESEVKQGTRVQ